MFWPLYWGVATTDELIYFNVEVIDADGQRVPNAEVGLFFRIDGPGVQAAVLSGHPARMESFTQPVSTTFKGRSPFIVRPTGQKGQVNVNVWADGLGETSATVQLIQSLNERKL